MATAKKYYRITYKKRGSETIHNCTAWAGSVSEAKEQAKRLHGDIKIISCT